MSWSAEAHSGAGESISLSDASIGGAAGQAPLLSIFVHRGATEIEILGPAAPAGGCPTFRPKEVRALAECLSGSARAGGRSLAGRGAPSDVEAEIEGLDPVLSRMLSSFFGDVIRPFEERGGGAGDGGGIGGGGVVGGGMGGGIGGGGMGGGGMVRRGGGGASPAERLEALGVRVILPGAEGGGGQAGGAREAGGEAGEAAASDARCDAEWGSLAGSS